MQGKARPRVANHDILPLVAGTRVRESPRRLDVVSAGASRGESSRQINRRSPNDTHGSHRSWCAGGFDQRLGAEHRRTIDRALAAAPRQMREGATVIKWNPDFTYETLKKGTNRLVCYDRSGEPGEQPFAVQCTSVGNLERVAQNRRFEAETDKAKRQAALDAAEANGTRVKPEFGSVFYSLDGPDQATRSNAHDDRRAGRHDPVTRAARQSEAGRRLDHECGHDDRSHHDTGTLGARRRG